MRQSDSETRLGLGSPAVYRIVVQGLLDVSLSRRLAGMHIEIEEGPDAGRPARAVLTGRLADQAQLFGVLNNLHELRLPLLVVEQLQDGEWTRLPIE